MVFILPSCFHLLFLAVPILNLRLAILGLNFIQNTPIRLLKYPAIVMITCPFYTFLLLHIIYYPFFEVQV